MAVAHRFASSKVAGSVVLMTAGYLHRNLLRRNYETDTDRLSGHRSRQRDVESCGDASAAKSSSRIRRKRVSKLLSRKRHQMMFLYWCLLYHDSLTYSAGAVRGFSAVTATANGFRANGVRAELNLPATRSAALLQTSANEDGPSNMAFDSVNYPRDARYGCGQLFITFFTQFPGGWRT